MKAISFLGISDYKETIYSFPGGKNFTAKYFPFAVSQVYTPTQHYVFMTEDANKIHHDKMSALFKYKCKDIPTGKSEDEYWEIFDKLVECAEEGDEVLLDFTRGFRSQAILAVSALIFLKKHLV